MRWEYLLFNICILLFPVLATRFVGVAGFTKHMIRPVLFSAFLFILWDMLVIPAWWTFNPQYTLGIRIGTVPLEEVLFFFTVPTACLIFWQHIRNDGFVVKQSHWYRLIAVVAMGFGFVGCVAGLWYTGITLIACSIVIGIDAFRKSIFLTRSGKGMAMFVSTMTLIWNWYLTARPVVLYNPQVKTNLFIGPIPIEDFIYGWTLVGSAILWYEYELDKKPV